MAYRCAVFERHLAEAGQLRHAIQAAIASGGALPGAYRQAVARVLELVRRSVADPTG